MDFTDRQIHWDNIYTTKQLNEVSWYEPKPEKSLMYIREAASNKNAAIIDVGGGDSLLVDYLIEEGYTNLTVLDISEKAILRAKERLKEKALNVNWIVSDIVNFKPDIKYDVWHDRAAFHFLTDDSDRKVYHNIVSNSINEGGKLIIGTFSVNGPLKCSGIEIKQNSEESLNDFFKDCFTKKKCDLFDHNTPFGTVQNFIFCTFIKK